MKITSRMMALVAMLGAAGLVRAQDTAAPAAAAADAKPAAPAATAAPAGLEKETQQVGYTIGFQVSSDAKRAQAKIDIDAFSEGFNQGLTGEADSKRTSYAMGAQVGTQLKSSGIELDPEAFKKGFGDGIGGTEPAISAAEQSKLIDKVRADAQKRGEAKAAEAKAGNTEKSKAFFEENGKKEGVVTTASGLQYKILKSGDAAGKSPGPGDSVTAQYTGTLLDGTEFDGPKEHGGPQQFQVQGVIKGWTEVLQLMKVGDKWQVFIPAELGYGDRGSAPKIGPGDALIFEMELVSIIPGS